MKNYCLPFFNMIKLVIGKVYQFCWDPEWDSQGKEGETWFGGISGFWRC